MPERLTSNRKVIGTKQLRKALKAGRVRTAYVAADADPILREPLIEQCRSADVELVEVATMKELGRLCGIHVGAAGISLIFRDKIHAAQQRQSEKGGTTCLLLTSW